jgi:regulator of protease activity HflC (stomatin/prohibitin superfamily)
MPLGLTVIREYERGVVFRFGKLRPNVREPGLRAYIPFADRYWQRLPGKGTARSSSQHNS